jgi:hypothetical protein
MAYIVKDADVHNDKKLLLDILLENREKKSFPYDQRYDWLYLKNPFGEATAWVIWDDENGTPAGFTAVYPRKMLVHGNEYLCWNCGDFSITKKYRTLGVAVKLRKKAKQYVDRGDIPFLYAHPNNQMVHVHIRVGHRKIAQMKRFALPIRFSKYVANNTLGKVSGTLIDPLVAKALKTKYRKSGDYICVDKSMMNFNGEYLNLCYSINKKLPVIGLRSQDYLNWKYRDHPVFEFRLFNFFQESRFSGFIIFKKDGDTIYMSEVVCPLNDSNSRKLIKTFVHFILNEMQDVSSISTVQQEHNPIIPSLVELGFKYRDDSTSDVIAYGRDIKLKDVIHDGRNWFMNVGDRDS